MPMNRSALISYFILAAFIGLAVFGFAVMGTHAMDGQANCIALIGQGTPCLNQNMLTMAVLHANFFQMLTSITILLMLFAFALIAIEKISAYGQSAVTPRVMQRTNLIFRKSQEPILRWINLHARIA